MKKLHRVLIFLAVFSFALVCSVVLAFCGGATFGTPDFGWLVGMGMMVGGVAGVLTATFSF